MTDGIYISGERLDMSPGSPIAVTYQVNDIAELANRQANYTNTIDVPKTEWNRSKLGFADEIGGLGSEPYTLLDAKIISGGAEIVSNGIAIIEAAEEVFRVTIYSGIFDPFEQIRQKNLADTELSGESHTWDAATVAAGCKKTNGYIYPILHYGVAATPAGLDARYSLPGMLVSELITAIFAPTGYTLSGDDLTDPFYLSLFFPGIPRDRLDTTRWTDEHIFQYENAFQRFDVGGQPQTTFFEYEAAKILTYDTEADGSPFFNLSKYNESGETFCDFTGETTIDVFTDSSTNINTGTHFWLEIVKERGGVVEILDFADITGTGIVSVSASDVALITGDSVYLRFRNRHIAANGLQATIDFSIDTRFSDFQMTDIDADSQYGSTIQMTDLFPKMSQLDFVKAIAQIRGWVFQVKNQSRTIEIRRIEEVLTDRNDALDWSGKLVKLPGMSTFYESKTFTVGNYGQASTMRWADDDTVEFQYADGAFQVENETLEREVNVLTLPFSATENRNTQPSETFTVAEITRWVTASGGGYELNEDKAKHRIVYLTLEATAGFDVIDATVTVPVTAGNVQVANFMNSAQSENLGFQNDIIDRHYAAFTRTINRAVKYTAWMLLNAVDIENLDFLKLVYISGLGGYFMLNSVQEYQGENMPTKVELIEVK